MEKGYPRPATTREKNEIESQTQNESLKQTKVVALDSYISGRFRYINKFGLDAKWQHLSKSQFIYFGSAAGTFNLQNAIYEIKFLFCKLLCSFLH